MSSLGGQESPMHVDANNQDPPLALPAPPPANPRRLPPPCWSHDETIALIDAYRDKWYALRRGNLKANHWQEVADDVGRRCPGASPPKTAVQCRHKMEKLRKRYRTEIQRARSMPVSRFSSSWVHFKRMDSMEKGPRPLHSESEGAAGGGGDDNDDDDDDLTNPADGYYPYNNNNNNGNNNNNSNNKGAGFSTTNGVFYAAAAASASTRSVAHKLYNNNTANCRNGMDVSPPPPPPPPPPPAFSASSTGGFRIRIPTGVSIAQPAPAPAPSSHKFYSKVNLPTPASGFNPHSKANYAGMAPTRVARGATEDLWKKRDRDPMEDMVAAIKLLGDGFVRMEQMKMEMAREMETMRMEMEMKRTEMILDSQHRIVEAFTRAFSDKKRKKMMILQQQQQQQQQELPKRLPSPTQS